MTLLTTQKIKAPTFETIPQGLKDHPKWMLWKAEPTKKDPNVLGKVPYQVNGYRASKTNPKHYLTFEQAKTAYKEGGFDGVGVVINRNDSLVCVDLDDFEDISKIPAEKYNLIMIQSYTEYSPSEKGLHTWVRGKKPEWCGTKRNGVELYGGDGDSFITVTGHVYNMTSIAENQKIIDHIVDRYFKEDKPTRKAEKRTSSSKEEPDEIVLAKMFNSKTGKKIEQLFNGFFADYESDSEADLALCSHLAYWTNNNPDQMDRLFRQSGLYREKWDEKRPKGTYGSITIEKAFTRQRGAKSESNQSDVGPDAAANEFLTNDQNRKIVCLHNTQTILSMLEIEVYYDVIKKRSLMKSNNKIFNGSMTDYHVVKIIDFALNFNYKISKNTCADHLMALAKDHSINKVKKFFDRARSKWDGTSRIDDVFNTLHSRTERELGLAYFKKFCIQAVRLAENDDGKMNQEFVLVLQGGQDAGKTSWLKLLFEPIGTDYFKEGLELKPDNKDIVLECISHFVVELGELDATMKHEQAQLKAFITRSWDEIRKPYERLSEQTPRQTVLCATVNEEDFLKDKTGNRRYGIIKTGERIDRLSHINLEQFWGEIATLAADGESHHLSQEEKQKQRTENSNFETLSEAEIRVETNFYWGASKDQWKKRTMAHICEVMGMTKQSKNVGNALRKKGCEYNDKDRPRTWTVPPIINNYAQKSVHPQPLYDVDTMEE